MSADQIPPAVSDDPPVVVGYVGVYDADGGPVGEVRYVIGSLLGTAHCSLCDVTHGPLRRRPAWDAMVAQLGVPFTLLHRNELDDDDIAAAVEMAGMPLVLARLAGGGLAPVLLAADLAALDGSVANLEAALGRAPG